METFKEIKKPALDVPSHIQWLINHSEWIPESAYWYFEGNLPGIMLYRVRQWMDKQGEFNGSTYHVYFGDYAHLQLKSSPFKGNTQVYVLFEVSSDYYAEHQ